MLLLLLTERQTDIQETDMFINLFTNARTAADAATLIRIAKMSARVISVYCQDTYVLALISDVVPLPDHVLAVCDGVNAGTIVVRLHDTYIDDVDGKAFVIQDITDLATISNLMEASGGQLH
jgi:hypothetical protein